MSPLYTRYLPFFIVSKLRTVFRVYVDGGGGGGHNLHIRKECGGAKIRAVRVCFTYFVCKTNIYV